MGKVGEASVLSFPSSSLFVIFVEMSALQKETLGLPLSQEVSSGPLPLWNLVFRKIQNDVQKSVSINWIPFSSLQKALLDLDICLESVNHSEEKPSQRAAVLEREGKVLPAKSGLLLPTACWSPGLC